MELVFENGQVLAKSQRTNVSLQNQRTISIMDLYETEYNEDFKMSILGCCAGSIKNLGGKQVVEEHDVVVVSAAAADETDMLKSNKHVVDYDYQNNIDFIPPDEQSVVAEWSVKSSFHTSYADFTEDSEESSWSLSSSLDDDDDVRPQVSARTRKALVKRKRSKQRKDINKRMRTLQDLLPNNSHKDDSESTLDDAINYMTTLQYQIQMMTMGFRFVTPSMMFPMGPDYSQMGLATCMHMGVPQFMPAPLPGTGLPGTSDAPNMLRFLNHPGLMPMQNSPFFTPMDNNCYPPSCVTFPNQPPNSTSGKSSGKP